MKRIIALNDVESVDKFSTFSVDKSRLDRSVLMSKMKYVESVDKFSTLFVDK